MKPAATRAWSRSGTGIGGGDMDYRIDIYDTWGRHVASYDEVPIAEASQSAPDEPTVITGLLPGHVVDLSHGYRV